MKRVGIIGHRSWIGQALADQLKSDYQVVLLDKSLEFGTTGFMCLYIIPGKLQQDEDEKAAEIDLVERIAKDRNSCQRQVLLSSRSVYDGSSEYAQHKTRVENAYFWAFAERKTYHDQLFSKAFVIRPGAIFGPTQSINAPMLIPQIAREGENVVLNKPDRLTTFISVNDLTKYMAQLAENDYRSHDSMQPIMQIPGQFECTPRAIKDLWETFNRIGQP